MEQESPDESFDSIPQPEYEVIENTSGSSTPTSEEKPNVEEEIALQSKAENLRLAQKEHDFNETKNLLATDVTTTTIASHVETAVDDSKEEAMSTDDENTVEPDEEAPQLTYNNANLVEAESMEADKKNAIVSMVPIKIISSMGTTVINTPKLVPVKTKNKVLMVQLVGEQGKPVMQTLHANVAAGELLKSPLDEQQQPSRAARSSTPLSREIQALQKSVNESKILSEFVTDATAAKARKLRKAGHGYKDSSAERNSSKTQDMSYSDDADASNNQRRSGKLAPLKDETAEVNEINAARLSRSKSVNRKSSTSDSRPSRRSRSRSRSLSRKSPQYDPAVRFKRWPSDEKISKRTNMRSQNSEFVQKQMEFLNRVKSQQGEEADVSDIEDDEHYAQESSVTGGGVAEDTESQVSDVRTNELSFSMLPQYNSTSIEEHHEDSNDFVEIRMKSYWRTAPKPGWDSYCWKCHESADLIPCSKCIRSFHSTCIKVTAATKLDNTWVCPECTTVENMLNGPKRTRRSELPLELLGQLLSFALKRMRNVKGYNKFLFHSEELRQYSKYIVNPVMFSTLQERIEKKVFRCAEEFVNETKWMLHNALIIASGTTNSKDVLTAKSILKICRQEANEIDTCAECYLNANTRSDWFVDVCTQPHLLLWAKLKGFPYWPAKAMGPGQGSHVNVRFFGEHDRAFVPIKDCFLYSEQDPNTQTGKRSARELADCIKEVEVHIKKIKAKIGDFQYAVYKTPYEPAEEMQQLERMMPGLQEYMKRQQTSVPKQSPLQFKIVKTADNHLLIKKANSSELENEVEHSSSSSPSKKNKESEGVAMTKVTTTKYEVISKATSDDSNSSKVSTVILKRKSISGEQKKSEEEVELPLPKMTKIENAGDEVASTHTSPPAKRKHGSDGSPKEQDGEKHKSKHTKHEPRVMLTIKTNGSKLTEAKQQAPDENVAQSVMENLVKNKQGVTIKKIVKETSKKTNTESVETKQPEEKTTKPATVAAGESKSKVTATSELSEKAKHAQKVTNILKDLVPFVEIKKEATSDDEETPPNAAAKKPTTTTTNITATAPTTPAVNAVVPAKPAPTATEPPPLLTTVKQEVVSDDEDTSQALLKSTLISGNANMPSSQAPTNNATAATTEQAVRVVGDTTIQRILVKNAAATLTPAQNSTTINAHSPQASVTSTHTSKRINLRGVPFGPLPASAVATLRAPPCSSPSSTTSSTNPVVVTNISLNPTQQQQLQQLRQNQRARKSFPNRSPSDVSPARVSNAATGSANTSKTLSPSISPISNTAVVVSTASALNNDQKRTMLRTNMVSIPVDVATNRNSNNAIPVPPLTAVSKTTPASLAVSSAGTTIVSSATVTPIITAATFANCNGASNALLTPLNMSAPPPLAGLSQSSSSIITPNVVNLAINAASSVLSVDSGSAVSQTTTPPTATATDAHILGDFVTPSLAAAITEVICRGPPKMAARPNGPLQSDGSTMFPSQAGPVCRTLVENAHKLTDFFISVMEDTMCEMSVGDESLLQAKITLLTMELERTKQAYEHEIAELKRTSDLMLCEMRKSMENEKNRISSEIRKQCELERLRSIEETKKKQWCSNCGREAQFYCCWNTSYCDYPCQQLHWTRHAASCAQTRPNESNNSSVAVLATTPAIAATSTAALVASTNNVNVSGATAAGNAQQERLHQHHHQQHPYHHHHHKSVTTNASNTVATATTNATQAQYGKIMIGNSKKEKHATKGSSGAPSAAAANNNTNVANATQAAAELLKLPTNTYLRAVPASAGNSNNARSASAAYALPVQRFNIPLPITASVNAGPPYTIVQRGSNWELMSTTANSANMTTVAVPSGVAAATNVSNVNSTSSAQQQQVRIISNAKNASARNRVTTLQAAMGRPAQI